MHEVRRPSIDRLRSSTALRLGVAALFVAAASAWIGLTATAPPPAVQDAALPPAASRPEPAAAARLAAHTTAPASSGGRAAPDESLAARVDRLSRSSRPADAYAAYRLVRACVEARHRVQQGKGSAQDERAACADLASDQIQARLAWLDRAAQAGVRNAAADYGTEGPAGLLVPPEAQGDWAADAAWQARMAGYYDRGAQDCDVASVLSVVVRYRLGKFPADPRLALMTWAAAQECIALGKAVSQLPDPRDAGVVPALSALLGPDEAQAAIAAGQASARAAPPFGG